MRAQLVLVSSAISFFRSLFSSFLCLFERYTPSPFRSLSYAPMCLQLLFTWILTMDAPLSYHSYNFTAWNALTEFVAKKYHRVQFVTNQRLKPFESSLKRRIKL